MKYFYMQNYEIFLDATISRARILKMSTYVIHFFRDGPLEYPPLLISINRGGRLRTPTM